MAGFWWILVKIIQKTPSKKCPFFWFVFFGQTKKMNKYNLLKICRLKSIDPHRIGSKSYESNATVI